MSVQTGSNDLVPLQTDLYVKSLAQYLVRKKRNSFSINKSCIASFFVTSAVPFEVHRNKIPPAHWLVSSMELAEDFAGKQREGICFVIWHFQICIKYSLSKWLLPVFFQSYLLFVTISPHSHNLFFPAFISEAWRPLLIINIFSISVQGHYTDNGFFFP